MKKTLMVGMFAATLAILVGGGAAVGAIYYMKDQAPLSSGDAAAASATKQKAKKEGDDVFVTLPESLITLHDNSGNDRYMLLEVAMVADDEKASKKILADEPLYQSIIVSTLSDMEYDEVRKLKVSEIKQTLLTALKAQLKARDISAPYSDVLLKKVVYQ